MASDLTLLETDTQGNHQGVRIAIEGCGHGTLNNIYSSITTACKAKSWPGVDLLIIGGDFQAVRNSFDLNAMAVPAKYREIGDFHEYYSGKRTAPYLTIFIGGNHEASNHLTELYYGGWVAPRIYYVGAANVLRFGPLRIAGISGIWKGYHYRKPHYERLPYAEDDKKSVYHVRELDARKLLQIRTQVDIGLSHDWPEGIQWCGDWKTLFRYKPFLEQDARSGRLGNIAAKEVLQRLRPRYWFSAHLHTKFTALVKYDSGGLSIEPPASVPQKISNEDEIDISIDERPTENPRSNGGLEPGPVANSDEIELDLDDLSDGNTAQSTTRNTTANVNGTTNPDELDIDMESNDIVHDTATKTNGIKKSNEIKTDLQNGNALGVMLPSKVQPQGADVSEDIRAQLPDSFKPQPPPAKLPFPQGISNDTTRFLALNKCLPGRDFLQLVEIPAAAEFKNPKTSRPFKLEYDKEWLAITRVFAKDLVIGDERAQVPRYAGDAVYRQRILEEEAWVEEHIISQNKMAVPENFVLTAPVYDPSIGIHTRERPVEYANPQTGSYCSLLQIDNPLVMSEQEKTRRQAESIRLQNEVPQRDQHSHRGHFRGGRPGRGRGRGRGR